MTVTKILPLTLALAVLAGGALAQTPAAKPAAATAAKPGENAEAMFKSIDSNGDKMISLNEFKSGLEAQRQRSQALQRLQAQFKQMDKNKSGGLESAEFNELPLVKSGVKPVPTFAETDGNRDQKVDFREYVGAVGKYIQTHPAPAKP